MVIELFEINSLKLAHSKSCTIPSTTRNILPQYPPNCCHVFDISPQRTQPFISFVHTQRHLALKWHRPQVSQMRITHPERRLIAGQVEITHWCLEGLLNHERQARLFTPWEPAFWPRGYIHLHLQDMYDGLIKPLMYNNTLTSLLIWYMSM